MPANEVQLIFEGDATPLGRATKEVNDAVGASITSVQKKALDLDFTLRKVSEVSVGRAGFDGLGKAADRAQQEVRGIYADLQRIERQMSVTRDFGMLKKLEADALKAGERLDQLNTKVQRVAAGRAAAAERSALAGTLTAGRAQGALNFGAIAGVPGAGEASAALGALEGLGVAASAAFLAVAGSVAVAGYAAVKWSESVREEAKKQLDREEALQGAINKRILAGQAIVANYKEQTAALERQSALQDFIAKASVSSITARLALTEKLLELTKDPRYAAEGLELQKGKSAARANETQRLNEDFNARNELFKQQQKQEREAEQRRLEGVQKGLELAKKTGDAWKEAFAGIAEREGAHNPFVKIYSDGETALKTFREQTKGLSQDLREQGEVALRNQQALSLFSARVDSAMTAASLRDEARRLREDPNAAEKRATALAKFDARRKAEEASGLYRNPLYQDIDRALIAQSEDRESAADRFDRQARKLRSFGGVSDEEKALIDSRLIGLSKGVDPKDLRDDQREQVAKALERQAERTERREIDAMQLRQKTYEVQKDLAGYLKRYFDTAQKEGIKGVDTLIRIQNESDAQVEAREAVRRPTPEDTRRTYDLGLSTGSGGLSSF